MNAVLQLHLIDGAVPVVVDVLGIVMLVLLMITRRWRRWLPIAAAVSVGGFLLGLFACWLLGDQLDLFGVTLSIVSRLWVGVAFAGFALGIARLIFSAKRTAGVWAASALVLALLGGLGLNADLGEFPTVKNALGIGEYSTITLPDPSAGVPLAGWKAPAVLPSHGRVGLVTIPPATSNFPARPAVVYLPPAALVPNPPRLPVLEMLSGQPGQPDDLFIKGGLASYLDALAKAHHGLAPIVVVPDQLGAPAKNPMCVNSALGNSASYLTVDVPRWITEHLAVASGARSWGIGGFSQGGTCAIQLGAQLPGLYGTIFDISGEIAPKSGSVEHTIETGFAGSRTAYEAAIPSNIMRRVDRYSHSFAVFSVGAGDTKYGPGLAIVAKDAAAVGMQTSLFVSPGTAHDWRTVKYAFERSLPEIDGHWGLNG